MHRKFFVFDETKLDKKKYPGWTANVGGRWTVCVMKNFGRITGPQTIYFKNDSYACLGKKAEFAKRQEARKCCQKLLKMSKRQLTKIIHYPIFYKGSP